MLKKSSGNFSNTIIFDDVKQSDCDQKIDVPIAESIIHENYVPHERHNDIALIRLAQSVQFSNWIKPICLPFAQHLRNKSYDDSLLTTAGFGNDKNGKFAANILLFYESLFLEV